MKYDVNIIINQLEKQGTIQLNNNSLELLFNDMNKIISFNDILCIEESSLDVLNILLTNKHIITLYGSNIPIINNFFTKFKTYNESNIKINDKAIKKQKNAIRVCLIYTIITILIYNGLVGYYLAESMGTSFISSFLGGMLSLGNFSDYPMESLQKVFYVLLVLEIILLTIYQSSFKKSLVNELRQYIFDNQNLKQVGTTSNLNKYDELEKLKELLDKNIITQEDFDKKKKELLNL